MSTTSAKKAATSVIQLRGVSKTFNARSANPVHAVTDLNLDISSGEVVAFLGPNGAGKTTAIDMMLGLTTPTSGTVRVLGTPPRTAIARGQISAVLQTGGLLRDLTVRETVRMIASTFTHPADVDDVLQRADLTALAGRQVGKCSGGEQQRLRFALSLLPNPEVLVLDEPTAGMDVGGRHNFWATMHAEARNGRTVLFATHYLEEADSFAERIVMIDSGRVVADDQTEAIRARASGRTVSADVPSEHLSAAADNLGQHEAVLAVDRNGNRLTVRSSDSDAVARMLLTEFRARNLEITSGSLDDAFLALTGSHPHTDQEQS